MDDNNKVVAMLMVAGAIGSILALAWFLNEIADVVQQLGGFPIP